MNAIVQTTERQLPEPVSTLPSSPMEMISRAVERGASMEQISQLMDLQDRWEAKEARKAYVAAMARFKANPPEILKGKHVKYTTKSGQTVDYHHATLADVCDAAIKGLALVGISHRWDVVQAQTIEVTCILTHELGHCERVSMKSAADDSGGKNNIQAIASAVTYLSRYTLMAATGLAAAEMDDDGKGAEPPETITEKQEADLHALASEVGADPQRFLKYMGVERCKDILSKDFQKAVNALRAKGKNSK